MKRNLIYYMPLAGFIIYFLEYYSFPYTKVRGRKASMFILEHFSVSIVIAVIYHFLIK